MMKLMILSLIVPLAEGYLRRRYSSYSSPRRRVSYSPPRRRFNQVHHVHHHRYDDDDHLGAAAIGMAAGAIVGSTLTANSYRPHTMTSMAGGHIHYRNAMIAPPVNELFRIAQGEYCLDHHVEMNDVVLYSCDNSEKKNQQWVLQKKPTWSFAHIYTPVGAGGCITAVPAAGYQVGTPPPQGTQIKVITCDEGDNPLQGWAYEPNMRNLHLTKFPNMCLDFSEAERKFVLWPCITSWVGGAKYNQELIWEMLPYHHDTTPQSPSVNPQAGKMYVLTMGRYCLDCDVAHNNLVLYDCKGGVNQEWSWKQTAHGFQLFTPAANGKCLRVEGAGGQKPQKEAAVLMSDCSSGDQYESWTYQFGDKRFVMATWPDLCLDYQSGGMFSSGKFIVYPCKMEAGHGEAENEIVHVKDLPFQPMGVSSFNFINRDQSIPEIVADSPSAFYAMITFAIAFLFCFPLAIAIAIRRRRVQEQEHIALSNMSDCELLPTEASEVQ